MPHLGSGKLSLFLSFYILNILSINEKNTLACQLITRITISCSHIIYAFGQKV